MLVKEMLLIKRKYSFFYYGFWFCSLFFLLTLFNPSFANSNQLDKEITNYISSLKSFKSDFLQIINLNEISEGTLYIKKNKLRMDYKSPSKLVFIVKNRNAAFYNVDLDELQFFNPKNTPGKFLLNFFSDKNFFNGAIIGDSSDAYAKVIKSIIINDNDAKLTFYLEKKPINLRKIHYKDQDNDITLSFNNIDNNTLIDESIFSLAPSSFTKN